MNRFEEILKGLLSAHMVSERKPTSKAFDATSDALTGPMYEENESFSTEELPPLEEESDDEA